jgi:hypothetical protein
MSHKKYVSLSPYVSLSFLCIFTTQKLSKRRWDLRFTGILRSAEWYFCTDVSRQPFEPIFKFKEAFEDWPDRLSRNVGTELPLSVVYYPRRAAEHIYIAVEALNYAFLSKGWGFYLLITLKTTNFDVYCIIQICRYMFQSATWSSSGRLSI